MDKKEAIEFLTQKLNKINYLKSLPHDNSEQRSWRKDIEYVLKEEFGPDSTEYNRFFETFLNVHVFGKEQEEYLKELELREQALLFIINKVASDKKSIYQKVGHFFDHLWQVTVKNAFEGIVNGLKKP
jgi:hypothetical protein